MHLMAWLYVFQTVIWLAVSIREAVRPARAVTWLFLCALLPGLGLLIYLVLNRPLPVRRPPLRSRPDNPLPAESPEPVRRLSADLRRLTGAPILPARVRVLRNGIATYRALLQALTQAQRTIDFEFYIYRDDHVGRRITDALAERAQAGVRVRVLLDGWGSRQLSRQTIQRLAAAGAECRWLFPLRWRHVLHTLNYRDHCKIVVVDDEIGFTGGLNVGDEYTGRKPKVGPWRDTHVQVTGPAAARLRDVFESNWSIGTPAARDARDPVRGTLVRTLPLWTHEWAPEVAPVVPTTGSTDTPGHDTDEADAFVQIIESGPDERQHRFRDVFFLTLTQVRRSVDVTTPYFAPGADIVTALTTAAQRGVRVRLLLPKVPDHRLLGWAQRTYYKDLMAAGVQVYLYDGGILHAKVMTVDDETAVVGAANYDWRSFRLDFEVGAVIYSPVVVRILTEQFEADLQQSTAATFDQVRSLPFWRRTLDHGARLLAPLL